jgi:hypothetical protein
LRWRVGVRVIDIVTARPIVQGHDRAFEGIGWSPQTEIRICLAQTRRHQFPIFQTRHPYLQRGQSMIAGVRLAIAEANRKET